MNQRYIINVDWFQIACTRDLSKPITEHMYFDGRLTRDDGGYNRYQLQSPREFNALFNTCYLVTLHNFPIANLYLSPRPSTINPCVCLVKLANPILYGARWLWYLQDVMDGLGWRFHNISRMDLAIDFNYFAGELHPQEFINRYTAPDCDNYEVPHYYRLGSNRFAFIADKVHDRQSGHVGIKGEYLRWGSRSSGVCVYLYDKSKELNDKGGKEYIRDLWAMYGLEDNDKEHVWRMEFSISNSATRVKRQLTEREQDELNAAKSIARRTLSHLQIRKLSLDDFSAADAVQRIFWAYADVYARFKVIGTDTNTSRWDDVTLFEEKFTVDIKPYNVHGSVNSGIAERNACLAIGRVLEDNVTLSLTERLSLEDAAEIMSRFSKNKGAHVGTEGYTVAAAMLSEGYDYTSIKLSGRLPRNHSQLIEGFVSSCVAHEVDNARDAQLLQDADDEDKFYWNYMTEQFQEQLNYESNERNKFV